MMLPVLPFLSFLAGRTFFEEIASSKSSSSESDATFLAMAFFEFDLIFFVTFLTGCEVDQRVRRGGTNGSPDDAHLVVGEVGLGLNVHHLLLRRLPIVLVIQLELELTLGGLELGPLLDLEVII